jgi:uncharacterized OB-fold protein
MAAPHAVKPGLYAVDAPAGQPVGLAGGRCVCGYVFFPMQTYGCEKCGRFGDDLTPALLAGRGTLIASARVHFHAGKDRAAPFTVAAVKLAEGPVVRSLVAGDDTVALLPGQAMTTILVPVGTDAGGATLVDLRFVPVP